ncbi:hypothetical protein [Tolumonas lignilytica]|uniref:hypothetical protein n=1 Tax=Tolumonas lignilytica TaxID=1283284 RepID=UPI0004646F14|nr:hypothetical protein [Tolumonas lignilytica]
MSTNNLIEDQYNGPFRHSSGTQYVHQEYPKWIHSLTGESRIVDSEDDYLALDGDWFDSKEEAKNAVNKNSILTSGDDEQSEKPKRGRKSKEEKEVDELLVKVELYGLPIQEDWTLDKIREEVAKAEAEQE